MVQPARRVEPLPPPAPRRPRRHLRWLVSVLVVVAIAIVAGLALGLVVERRVATGRWELPEVRDVVELVTPAQPPRPSRTIYLERGAVTLRPGRDDAPRGVSGVVAVHHPTGPVTMPGWKGSTARWKKLVACVEAIFAPFDVRITDERPSDDDYVLVAVGGRPRDLGLAARDVSGLAPFHGGVIPRAVVFAFAAQVKHDVRATCETIAMEVAHAYGLDHGYLCKDVMTYLRGCGAKSFVDKDVPCGEKKRRACHGGAPTQNSYRHLMTLLGPRAR